MPAFDEVLQRGVFADEFAGLHVLLAEAGEEDLCRTGAVAIVVDVDVAVRSLRDVGVGDVGALVEQQLPDQVLPSSVERKAVSSCRPGVAFVHVLAVTDDEQVARLQAADDGLAVHMRKGGGLRLPGLAAIGRRSSGRFPSCRARASRAVPSCSSTTVCSLKQLSLKMMPPR